MNQNLQNQIETGQKIAQTVGQFGGVSNTPFHRHNGIDSPKLFPKDLGMLAGAVTLSAGSATITDRRIQPYPNSIILVSSCESHASADGIAFWGECFQGYATIGSTEAADRMNYLIILNP